MIFKPYYLNITVYGEGGTDESSIPDKPSNPDEPSKSDTPSQPDEPSKPEYSKSDNPFPVLTGDNLWKTCIVLGIILLASCVVVVVTGGKHYDKNKEE